MFRKLLSAMVLAAALPGAALAAGGAGEVTDYNFSFEGPFGSYDRFQLQRGFQVYQNVCAGCHGMQYVSFRALGEPGGPEFPEEQVRAIAAQYMVEDPITGEMREGKPSDNFPKNDAVGAPDMSLLAKARAGFHGPYGTGIDQLVNGIGGPEYIYSLLTHYNGEEQEVGSSILYCNETMSGGWISM
ncbi:MAG: cytochrome c1, partial [Pseudomonadota bacterium]